MWLVNARLPKTFDIYNGRIPLLIFTVPELCG
jgi:hypothetical protein